MPNPHHPVLPRALLRLARACRRRRSRRLAANRGWVAQARHTPTLDELTSTPEEEGK
jgi:hypothetical protein